MTGHLPGDALLVDLDGTLVDSAAVVARTWSAWAARHGLDPTAVLAVVQGRRAADSVRDLAPKAHLATEVAWLEDAEVAAAGEVRLLPGAAALVAALRPGEWAVVTSGGRRLAEARLAAVGLARPSVLVSADDVAEGKPHPDPYRKGAALLGVPPARCVVLEDAPAGVQAGLAAGARVLAVTTTHPATDLAGATVVVPSLAGVGVDRRAGRLAGIHLR